MNERILELAKQSGLIQYDSDGKIEEVKEFARLLIQECADIASINQFQSDEVGNYVRKHFGVKP
jgi:hypothetical protein